ncbi:carboxymuconolactone decarboxylase family protein [Hydrogenophaga pseudoflava]|uniref:carboxymuconolactone decarboxylase family protein n=1 Tax=Hydrogenophaga pseudoflava TaxID=47421 RepID=UPI0027E48D44|nr:carboxymuconolactone decarboxylase family protein [Hydrogenophaga pseudoflava]MDQ7743084.1 carboxymuconolactone decarboxylase family protein [Hydrogenophaga pseudoflava]
MKSRLPLPDVDRLDPPQQAVYRSIMATRGNLSGPFLAWMHSPELASHAEKLGAFCRYQTVFERVESELLILVVAAHFRCVGEQQIHEPIAEQAGLSAGHIADIRERRPVSLASVRLTLIHALAKELLENNRIGDRLYDEGIRGLGTQGMVELVGIVGYYSLVAMTLNAFDMQMA